MAALASANEFMFSAEGRHALNRWQLRIILALTKFTNNQNKLSNFPLSFDMYVNHIFNRVRARACALPTCRNHSCTTKVYSMQNARIDLFIHAIRLIQVWCEACRSSCIHGQLISSKFHCIHYGCVKIQTLDYAHRHWHWHTEMAWNTRKIDQMHFIN